jgi:hypothetical protein
MGDELIVELDADPLNAKKWVLYLDGQEMSDLSDTATARKTPPALVYMLRRTDKTKTAWQGILGSPTGTRKVEVSVARIEKDSPRTIGAALIAGDAAVFQLKILWTWWLAFGFVAAAAVLFLAGLGAVRSPMLRDNLLSQIPWKQRTFSLGRCQMALWFTLIIVSFFFLWALLWDYNTVTAQSLILMGIAAATGLGALAANTTNNNDVTNADKELRAAHFNAPEDIETVVAELESKQAEAANPSEDSPPSPALDDKIIQLEDRKDTFYRAAKDYISATYDPATGKYKYANIFYDLITDKDGPALHRLQVVGWTIALGLVFLIGVYRDLSMPEFSATLLALIAVSGASYVGFKFPEKT